MHRFFLFGLLCVALLGCPPVGGGGDGGDDDDGAVEGSRVTLETTLGTVLVTVYVEESPVTADNFLQYIDDGFFDGADGDGRTTFHRVMPGFMAQGGGLRDDGTRKATRPAIENESGVTGLSNVRGTLSMARTEEPHSATSQFFINVADNEGLDFGSETNPDGYAVFGEVAGGMDVVDAIVTAPTAGTTPIDPIYIESATRD